MNQRTSLVVKFSATETWHFRRLVDFLVRVEEYALETSDSGLLELVHEVQEDLRKRIRDD